MKKAIIAIILIALIISGCKFGNSANNNSSIKTPTTKYLPDQDSESYKAGLRTLEYADKFLFYITDMQKYKGDSSPKVKELINIGTKGLIATTDAMKLMEKLLSAQEVLDKENPDKRISAYTNLLKSHAALLANQMEIDTIHFDIDVAPDLSKLIKLRNELADDLGKPAYKQ